MQLSKLANILSIFYSSVTKSETFENIKITPHEATVIFIGLVDFVLEAGERK